MERVPMMARSLAPIAAIACLAAAPALQAQPPSDTDKDYSKLLQGDPQSVDLIEEVDSVLSGDEELEESYLAYQDSLSSNPELAEHEEAFFTALEGDSTLTGLLAEFEQDAAQDPEAADHLSSMDSLMVAEPELAEKMKELESAAAEDPGILEEYGDQMAYLWSRPLEAVEFFSDEDGPYYPGSDEAMVDFVYYLEGHPRLFRAYWSLFNRVGAEPALRSALFRHLRWYWHRKHLWRSYWRYRLRAARRAETHRIVWARRAYLGRKPWLGRAVWRHHFVVVRQPQARPVLWRHSAFVARHPGYAGAVARHRHWVRQHKPHAGEKTVKTRVKPKKQVKRAPGPKVKREGESKREARSKPRRKEPCPEVSLVCGCAAPL